MSNKEEKLRRHIENELRHFDNPYQMAEANDWSFGLVYYVLSGGYSPMLYAHIFPPQPRPRLVIDCPPELKARFDNLRTGMSRAEFLDALLDCWQGRAKLPY